MACIRSCWNKALTTLKSGLVRAGYHSKPSFLIIGAQKCGTSAISKYLSAHPNIIPAQKKEIHFFDHDIPYDRGIAWYHNHFPLPHKLKSDTITFETSPSYLYYPKSAGRIFSYDPRINLIVLLRDPVERAHSAWNMYRFFHENPQSLTAASHYVDKSVRQWIEETLSLDSFPKFDEAVRDEIDDILSGDSALEPSYVRRGIYYEQLLRYFDHFDRNQILVIDSSSLRINPVLVLNKVVRFLGLPDYDWSKEKLSPVNPGKDKKEIPSETAGLLREFYKPYNQRLYELLGGDFGWQ